MVLIFVAIIYIGVVVVLSETQQATKLSFSQSVLKGNVESNRNRMEKLTDGAILVVEQKLAQERMIASYVDNQMETMTMDQKLAQMMILTNS